MNESENRLINDCYIPLKAEYTTKLIKYIYYNDTKLNITMTRNVYIKENKEKNIKYNIQKTIIWWNK